MLAIIKSSFLRLRAVVARSLLDLGPGGLRYRPSEFSYPTVEELWECDRENLKGDFSRAIDRFKRDCL